MNLTEHDIQRLVNQIRERGPDRIVINDQGEAAPPGCTCIKPDVVFIRDDGWSLGAPAALESVASGLWEWVARTEAPFDMWFPPGDSKIALNVKIHPGGGVVIECAACGLGYPMGENASSIAAFIRRHQSCTPRPELPVGGGDWIWRVLDDKIMTIERQAEHLQTRGHGDDEVVKLVLRLVAGEIREHRKRRAGEKSKTKKPGDGCTVGGCGGILGATAKGETVCPECILFQQGDDNTAESRLDRDRPIGPEANDE